MSKVKLMLGNAVELSFPPIPGPLRFGLSPQSFTGEKKLVCIPENAVKTWTNGTGPIRTADLFDIFILACIHIRNLASMKSS